jgi:hypothetical protein
MPMIPFDFVFPSTDQGAPIPAGRDLSDRIQVAVRPQLVQFDSVEVSVRPLSGDGTSAAGECTRPKAIFVAGRGSTDSGGQWKLKLHEALCSGDLAFGAPSITATAADSGPVVATAGFQLANQDRELTLFINTFKPDGSKIPTNFFVHVVVTVGPALI